MTTRQAIRLLSIMIKCLGALLGEVEEPKTLRNCLNEAKEFKKEMESCL